MSQSNAERLEAFKSLYTQCHNLCTSLQDRLPIKAEFTDVNGQVVFDFKFDIDYCNMLLAMFVYFRNDFHYRKERLEREMGISENP